MVVHVGSTRRFVRSVARLAAGGGGTQPPANLTPPLITRSGTTITVDVGDWAGNPTSFIIRHLRNGTAYPGATSQSWSAPPEVWGGLFGCEVVGVNAAGQSLPALAQEVYIGVYDVLSLQPLISWCYARKMSASHVAPFVARNASNNPATQDKQIAFTATGRTDQASLLSHCGTGNGTIVQAFSAVGTNHLIQTVGVSQPRIVNAGAVDILNNQPIPAFDGIDDFMLSTNNINLSGNPQFTINMVHTATLPSNQVFISFGADGKATVFHYMGASGATGPDVWIGYGSLTQLAASSVVNGSVLSSKTITRTGIGGAAWTFRENGVLRPITAGNNDPVNLANSAVNLGRYLGGATGSNFALMRCSEGAIFPGVLPAADDILLQRNQGAFYGYTVP